VKTTDFGGNKVTRRYHKNKVTFRKQRRRERTSKRMGEQAREMRKQYKVSTNKLSPLKG